MRHHSVSSFPCSCYSCSFFYFLSFFDVISCARRQTSNDLINLRLPLFNGTSTTVSGTQIVYLSSTDQTTVFTDDSISYWNSTTSYLVIQLGPTTNIPTGTLFNVTVPSSGSLNTPFVWPTTMYDATYTSPTLSIHASSASTYGESEILNIYGGALIAGAALSLDLGMNVYDGPFENPGASFAQLVATTSKAYIEQAVFNSTTYTSQLPPSTGFMPVVKLPPRHGHTSNVLSSSFMGKSINRDMLVFGGIHNGVRNHLWIYRKWLCLSIFFLAFFLAYFFFTFFISRGGLSLSLSGRSWCFQ